MITNDKAFAIPSITCKFSRNVNKPRGVSNVNMSLQAVENSIATGSDNIRFEKNDILFTLGNLTNNEINVEPNINSTYDDTLGNFNVLETSNTLEVKTFSFSSKKESYTMNEMMELRLSQEEQSSGIHNTILLDKLQAFIKASSLDRYLFTGLKRMVGTESTDVITVTPLVCSNTYYPIEDADKITFVEVYKNYDNVGGTGATLVNLYKITKNPYNKLDMHYYKSYYLNIDLINRGNYYFYHLDEQGIIDEYSAPMVVSKSLLFTMIRCIMHLHTQACPKFLNFQNSLMSITKVPSAICDVVNRILNMCEMDDMPQNKMFNNWVQNNGLDHISTGKANIPPDRNLLMSEYGICKDRSGVQLNPLEWLTVNVLSKLDLFKSFEDLECETPDDKVYANLAFFDAFKNDLEIKKCNATATQAYKDISSMSDMEVCRL